MGPRNLWACEGEEETPCRTHFEPISGEFPRNLLLSYFLATFIFRGFLPLWLTRHMMMSSQLQARNPQKVSKRSSWTAAGVSRPFGPKCPGVSPRVSPRASPKMSGVWECSTGCLRGMLGPELRSVQNLAHQHISQSQSLPRESFKFIFSLAGCFLLFRLFLFWALNMPEEITFSPYCSGYFHVENSRKNGYFLNCRLKLFPLKQENP